MMAIIFLMNACLIDVSLQFLPLRRWNLFPQPLSLSLAVCLPLVNRMIAVVTQVSPEEAMCVSTCSLAPLELP
jgi:hypothetical protein